MRKVPRIRKTCITCKRSIFLPNSKILRGKGKYCSISCKAYGTIAGWNKGIPRTWKNLDHHTAKTRIKIGFASKGRWAGDKNPNWRGGIDRSKERHLAMQRLEYILWRTAVFTRDYWTCVLCGYKGKDIEADHIKPWSLYPALRYAIDNGRTLCKSCHRQTDTWGSKVFSYKERMVV